MKEVIGSIVVFNPQTNVLQKTIETFLESAPESIVYIWDNSPEDRISKDLLMHFPGKIKYHKSPTNWGFGRGHNGNFKKVTEPFEFFCVLNPDLEIPKDTLPSLISYLKANKNIGLVTGLIRGENGVIHQVHKYLPSFKDYISSTLGRFFKSRLETTGTKLDLERAEPFSLPILSGCFLLFTKKHYEDLQGFDDRFFLYFEDYDISLRSFLNKMSVILPNVTIVHKWERGSSKNKKLFLIHLISGIKFYLKWGFGSRTTKKVNSKNI